MKPRGLIVVGLLAVSMTAMDANGRQEPGQAAAAKTIEVGTARPILRAIETLRERYHLSITYEEPRYVHPHDLQDISYIHKGPIPIGAKLIAPRNRAIHFQYQEINGEPQEEVTLLLRRLLTEFAAQGGPVFEVRERSLGEATQWNVVAVRARGSMGDWEDQPDILGTPIFIPKAERSQGEFLGEILQQLRMATGYRVTLGQVDTNIHMGTSELGADNISVRAVLANLYGTRMVWDLNYDPEGDGNYVLNLVWTFPPQPYSLDAYRVPPRPVSSTPNGPPKWLLQTPMALRTPQGRTELQSKLGQMGYYVGQPTGRLDQQTVDALKKFQVANSLPVTGKPDDATLQRLGLFQGTSRN